MIVREKTRAIPKGIRYLSDWDDFKFSNFPDKFILNKQLPGCGFTEYCINGPENIILCSPRRILLRNKAEQHVGEVYHVVNSLETNLGHDKSLRLNKKEKPVLSLEKAIDKIRNNLKVLPDETLEGFEKRVQDTYINNYKSNYKRIYEGISKYCKGRIFSNNPIKILVTYDSYKIVLSVLRELGMNLDHFYTVVDEMQSLGSDARFKPEIEVEFFNQLDSVKHVCYASATPMLEEFLNMVEEFDGLSYIELDWVSNDPGRIVKPDLKVRTMKSTYIAASSVIQSYLNGDFEKVYKRDKDTGDIVKVESKECVMYVNSVNHILNIVYKTKLTPDQVNILCAETDNNVEKIKKKLGKGFCIGSVPKKGEPRKMFTLCTRTTYLGVDMYSDCAKTYIFSDSNIETLAVDIAEDLPQILGRQRSDDNPWKNSATFYYITLYDKNVKSKDLFDKLIAEKVERTNVLLSAYGKVNELEQRFLGDKFVDSVMLTHYLRDYVTLKGGTAITNYLVLANEIRAFKVQQLDYKDRASVFARIAEEISPIVDYKTEEVVDFMQKYDSLNCYHDRLRFLSESRSNLMEQSFKVILDQLPGSDNVKTHYLLLGGAKCKALGYNITRITKELMKLTSDHSKMVEDIINSFEIGGKYTLNHIKLKLTELYEKYKYPEKPSAKDIERYFEVDPCKVTVREKDPVSKNKSSEGIRQKAYKLIKVKSYS